MRANTTGPVRSVGGSWQEPSRPTDAQWSSTGGQELRVAALHDPPYFSAVYRADGSLHFDGLLWELWQLLADQLQLRFRVAPLWHGGYGHLSANGTWSGIVAELAYGRADVALSWLAYSPERDRVIDYVDAVPIDHSEEQLLVRQGAGEAVHLDVRAMASLLKPLTLEVWWTLLATLLAISVILNLTLRCEEKMCDEDSAGGGGRKIRSRRTMEKRSGRKSNVKMSGFKTKRVTAKGWVTAKIERRVSPRDGKRSNRKIPMKIGTVTTNMGPAHANSDGRNCPMTSIPEEIKACHYLEPGFEDGLPAPNIPQETVDLEGRITRRRRWAASGRGGSRRVRPSPLHHGRQCADQRTSWDLCLLRALMTLVGQGWECAPERLPTRVVALSAWMLGLIICTSYTANLTSHLAASRPVSPIDGLRDFIGRRDWLLATEPGQLILSLWAVSDDPAERELSRRYEHGDRVIVANLSGSDEHLASLLQPRVVLNMDLRKLRRWLGEQSCVLMPLPKAPRSVSLNGYLTVSKRLPLLRKALNEKLILLTTTGVLRGLKNKWLKAEGSTCTRRPSFRQVTLGSVVGAVMLLPLGAALSLVILGSEWLWFWLVRPKNAP